MKNNKLLHHYSVFPLPRVTSFRVSAKMRYPFAALTACWLTQCGTFPTPKTLSSKIFFVSPNISLPPFLLKEKVEPKVQADFDAEHFLC